jgi:hypothetical protein
MFSHQPAGILSVTGMIAETLLVLTVVGALFNG